MSNEKISVIIPVYNTEKYVEATVRSVMNQTYGNLEIICINDGSTDGSLAILERLSKEDDRIIVLDKENTGQGDSRNLGISHATSEWLSFIDSDDTLCIDTYERVAEAIDLNPDMIHFGINMVYEKGVHKQKTDEEYYAVRYSGLTELTDSMIYRSDGSASNKIFKKSRINELGLSFPSIRYEDFAFSVSYMLMSDKVFYIKDKLYNYQRRAGSTMTETFQGSPYSIDHLFAYDYVLDFLKTHNALEQHRRIMVKYFVAYYHAAIKYSTKSIIPKIVEFADEIYDSNPFISKKVVRYEDDGAIVFRMRERRFRFSTIGHKIFSLKYEYIDNHLYKVCRVFGILVYKVARR